MAILYAIIQAILQAICVIFPVSDSAHMSAFHEFAGRIDGTVSALTGIINLAVSLGIILATLNVFIPMGREIVYTCSDAVHKNLRGSSVKKTRRIMYFSLISFAVLLLWLIPFGDAGFLYTVLHRPSYNGTLLDEGIMLAVTGGMLLAAERQRSIDRKGKPLTLFSAIFAGFLSLIMLPVSGFSLLGGIFAMLVIIGVSWREALRYALLLTAPQLFVLGIVQICVGEKVGVIAGILGAVIALVASFMAVKFLRRIIKAGRLNYFGIYDLGVGAIIAVIGIFQLVLG